jgi:hypothetical protein
VYDLIARSMTADGRSQLALAAVLDRHERRAVGMITAPLRLFRRGEPLALMPALEIEK